MTLTNAPVTYADSVSPSRRRWFVWTGAVVVLVIAALFWIGIRAAQAQHAMSHASDRFTALQKHLLNGDTAAAEADVAAIKKDTANARSKSNDWLVHAAATVPFLGRTPRSARSLAAAADDLAKGPLQSLLNVTSALSPKSVRSSDGTIDLTALSGSAAQLRSLATQLGQMRSRLLRSTHGALVLDPMDRARAATLRTLERTRDQVSVAARFATIGPAMLGDKKTRHYLVVVQNNNLARGTGGIVDSYATVDVRFGHAKVTKVATVASLPNARAWANTNTGLDFPTAASRWRRLFAKATHTAAVDGVIGLDPPAFEHLLRATGPVKFNGRVLATSTGVIALTEVRYATLKKPRVRLAVLAGVTRQLLRDVFAGKGDAKLVGRQIGASADDGHLRIWSAHTNEQAVLAETSYAGALPTAKVPFSSVVVNNTSGARLDYFLTRSMTYFAGPCRGSTRQSTVVMRLQNIAPGNPAAFLSAHTKKGQLRFSVSVYATTGTKLVSATLDGTAITMKEHQELGHPVFVADVAIERLAARTLAVQLTEPRTPGSPVVAVQPLGRPQDTTVTAAECSAS